MSLNVLIEKSENLNIFVQTMNTHAFSMKVWNRGWEGFHIINLHLDQTAGIVFRGLLL